jgi:hypothetical protein
MDLWWAVGLFGGYLLGSVSGTRLVAARVIPGVPLGPTRVVFDDRGHEAITTHVSSSGLAARAGSRAGGIAGLIDIAKSLIPVLGARFLVDDPVFTAMTAIGVLIGHAFPITHPREGGYGMSVMVGLGLALDPIALLVAIVVSLGVASVVGSPFVGMELWIGLLPVWFAYDGEPWFALATGIGALLYVMRGWSEYAPAWRAWRSDPRPWFARWSDYWEYPVYEPID